jgi:hypothetical protein
MLEYVPKTGIPMMPLTNRQRLANWDAAYKTINVKEDLPPAKVRVLLKNEAKRCDGFYEVKPHAVV